MGQKHQVATMSIEVAIETGQALADMAQLGGVVDRTTAEAAQKFDRIDAAINGMTGMEGLTASAVQAEAQLKKTAAQVREANKAQREYERVERAGEGMVGRLERELSVYGKTSSELRQMRAETAAVNAERQGQIELAGRIRAAEQAMYDAEFAAMRRAQQAADALAEEKAAAAAQAVRDAEREATATREAAHAYQMFEARVRDGAAALREQEAAASRDAVSLQRLREMLDPTGAAQERLNREMAESQRVMLAAGHSVEDVARAHTMLTEQHIGTVRSSGQVKAGMQQLQYNLNDMATMWAMNAKPMQIFASQAGQVIQAVQLMTAESKGLLGVLAGPWGLVITTAIVALAPLVAKMIESNHALDDAVDKLKKDAAETDLNARAKNAFARTIDGVTAAIKAETAARKEAIASQREAYEQDYLRAQFLRRNAETARVAAETELANAKLLLAADKARATRPGGEVASARVVDRFVEVRALETRLAGLDKSIAAARALETGALADAAVATAKRMIDPLARINALYDQRRDATVAAAEAAAAAGKTISGALTQELYAIERTRQAAIRAEQDKTAAAKTTANQIGRNITLAEARSIAQGVDGRVTSDHRSLEEQQRLYAKYQAYQAGTGPWAALAAKPGTSNHELDRAIDIAKGDGITLKKLIGAYRAAGVSLVEALDEGSHYHLAWKAVGTQARQETSARTEAVKAVKAAAKFNSDLLAQHGEFMGEQARHVQELMEKWGQSVLADGSSLDAGMEKIRGWIDHHGPIAELNKALEEQAAWWDDLGQRASESASNMERAFGRVGGAIGEAMQVLVDFGARQQQIHDDFITGKKTEAEASRASGDLQLSSMIGLTSAAKGLFSEHSKGYKAMEAAEKALTLVQLANTAISVAAGAAKMFGQLGVGGFPAVVAMGAVMAGLGFAVSAGGGKNDLPVSNTGTGTVLGDRNAQSESVTRAIEQLADIDKVTMTHSGAMLSSLRSIEQKIGGLASLLVRTGNIDASGGVTSGFKTDAAGDTLGFLASGGVLGSLARDIPVLGGILDGISGVVKSMFGTKTSVVASGLFGGPQTIADVLNAGFDASYFSDVKKTKKFFGVSAGTKYSTQYGDADSEIEQQFGLILRGFVDTIGAAAGPLGLATGAVEDRLSSFVVDLGKIDLQGLTGDEISEKLTAVFGKAADDMARAAMPGLEQFQRVGEGYFETLTRVAVTMETVSTSLGRLGSNAQGLDIAASMGLAGLFDSLSDLTSASDAYFQTYYSAAEQTAVRTAEMTRAFGALGTAMPGSLAGFRALVEAQDLTTTAGRQTYASLLQIAPAFADLNGVLGDVADASRSAADVLRERQGLERDLLQVNGDTAAIRALDLAALDASNRALQQHIWAVQDQQAATEAATQAAAAAAQAAEQAAAAEKARTDAILSERAGLEQRLLEMSGDTAAIRAAELAKLDKSNRAIQLRIYALTDEAAATQAATAAAAEAAAAAAAAAAKVQAVAGERAGLEQQLLQLRGDTAALRAIELAKLDESNRALQQQIYALQDAQKAAEAANALREAWQSVGDTIMEEVRRIRGLTESAPAGFGLVMGQFNAATLAARAGDQEAAKLLPGLSKSLLDAAALAATSRQELDRLRGQTAASLEETFRMIERVMMVSATATPADEPDQDGERWWNALAASQPSVTVAPASNEAARNDMVDLRSEMAGLREDLRTGLAVVAGNTGKLARMVDGVTGDSGGSAITVRMEAA